MTPRYCQAESGTYLDGLGRPQVRICMARINKPNRWNFCAFHRRNWPLWPGPDLPLVPWRRDDVWDLLRRPSASRAS